MAESGHKITNNVANRPESIILQGRHIRIPAVMGILNITDDSFYDGGRYVNEEAWIERVGRMVAEGAAIIDIGAASTRPGAAEVPEEVEYTRVVNAVKLLRAAFPDIILSIDTYRSRVADAALHAGACIINDISAGLLDSRMVDVVTDYDAPFILMHMQGTPATMQLNPHYNDVVAEVKAFLLQRAEIFADKGVSTIILDPGFGFGKTLEHNYALLNHFEQFTSTGFPVLAGLSRKSMIYKLLDTNPAGALNGTSALNMVALLKGASFLRVHDVKEAVEVVRLYQALNQ
ncbi:MAG: dihydropteroate synthase [Bacteroidales bacterium]|nr:dihydropteroate synthase [Bacteroidales bacterium]NPV37065.1 dihydropteroate synthase [Bacteroidales bacterium]